MGTYDQPEMIIDKRFAALQGAVNNYKNVVNTKYANLAKEHAQKTEEHKRIRANAADFALRLTDNINKVSAPGANFDANMTEGFRGQVDIIHDMQINVRMGKKEMELPDGTVIAINDKILKNRVATLNDNITNTSIFIKSINDGMDGFKDNHKKAAFTTNSIMHSNPPGRVNMMNDVMSNDGANMITSFDASGVQTITYTDQQNANNNYPVNLSNFRATIEGEDFINYTGDVETDAYLEIAKDIETKNAGALDIPRNTIKMSYEDYNLVTGAQEGDEDYLDGVGTVVYDNNKEYNTKKKELIDNYDYNTILSKDDMKGWWETMYGKEEADRRKKRDGIFGEMLKEKVWSGNSVDLYNLYMSGDLDFDDMDHPALKSVIPSERKRVMQYLSDEQDDAGAEHIPFVAWDVNNNDPNSANYAQRELAIELLKKNVSVTRIGLKKDRAIRNKYPGTVHKGEINPNDMSQY